MTPYEWTVVGAGPAGIAAVAKLLDAGVAAGTIAWIDPSFEAGDLGQKWRAVWSNTRVLRLRNFLNGSPRFQLTGAPHFAFEDLDPEDTCPLALIADPLVWITQQLRSQVIAIQTMATALRLENGAWTIETETTRLISEKVILAIGATPKRLDIPGLQEIPLDVALDPEKLAQLPLEGSTVAVFGSSHSSMIALPILLSNPVKKVINFYRSPLTYAVYLDDWILFDDTGLKGRAAQWARENIDGTHPDRLERCWVSSPDFQARLAECDHVVYTIGFERRTLPEVQPWGQLEHNVTNGIIAPGLFGLGIAFPEYRTDPLGYGQYRVGLQKFMDYLIRVLPLWMRYGVSA